MRLLCTDTLQLEEFSGERIPPYAILSHTWGATDEEVTFQDINRPAKLQKPGFSKVVSCANQAAQHGLAYVWIDTCCIDKSSSSELSEAINSMIKWYNQATICYAYLSDITACYDKNSNLSLGSFAKSIWFARCWTLQELLAPTNVIFYDSEWTEIGTKAELCEDLGIITDISQRVFIGIKELNDFPIAERMSWASHRQTARKEDLAYCLLGVFDINMPLLYGEGRKAFWRLQEEILKSSSDYTIFAWADPKASIHTRSSLLAQSPAHFAVSRALQKLPSAHIYPIEINNSGLTPKALISPMDAEKEIWQASFGYTCPSWTNYTFFVYLFALDGPKSPKFTSGYSGKHRRFARVCSNIMNLSPKDSKSKPGDLQTIVVPMRVDQWDHIRMSDIAIKDYTQNTRWDRSKKSTFLINNPKDEMKGLPVGLKPRIQTLIMISQREYYLSLRVLGLPLVPDNYHIFHRSKTSTFLINNPKDHTKDNNYQELIAGSALEDLPNIHVGISSLMFECSVPTCSASFVRRSDVKLREAFIHIRQGGSEYQLIDLSPNVDTSIESLGEFHENSCLNRCSITQSEESSGSTIISQKSRSHATNGTITPISMYEDRHEALSSSSSDASNSTLDSICPVEQSLIFPVQSSPSDLLRWALTIRDDQMTTRNRLPIRTVTDMVANLLSSTNWSESWRQNAGKRAHNKIDTQPVSRISSDQQSIESQKCHRSMRDKDGSEENDDDQHPIKRQRHQIGSSEGSGDRRLACPYFKHDPESHASRGACCGPGWVDVHRVKEHLYRCHAQPITCHRCNLAFPSDSDLVLHLQEINPCPLAPVNGTLLEGFSKDQERRLKKRASPRCEKEKWRKVYHILFPEVPADQIPSPHYEFEEIMPMPSNSPQGHPEWFNMVYDSFWQDPIIRSRMHELLTSNDAVCAGIQELFNGRHIHIHQSRSLERPQQLPLGLVAHLPAQIPTQNTVNTHISFRQQESSSHNSDTGNSSRASGQTSTQATTTEPSPESGQLLQTVDPAALYGDFDSTLSLFPTSFFYDDPGM